MVVLYILRGIQNRKMEGESDPSGTQALFNQGGTFIKILGRQYIVL